MTWRARFLRCRPIPTWWLIAATVVASSSTFGDLAAWAGVLVATVGIAAEWRWGRPPTVHETQIAELLEAIRLTQEYAQLPALDGWSWWDVYSRHRPGDAQRLRAEWERHDRAWRKAQGWPTR